jgi:pilus assembly protein CpaE
MKIMTSKKIEVGILASTPEAMESLAGHLEATQLAEVKIRVEQYCAVEDDYATHQFLEAQPEVILVDMRDERAAIKTLYVLNSVLPSSWLFACSGSNDPQLIVETMQVGAREYLAKPISARTLSLAFGRYLEAKDRLKKESKKRGKIYSITAAKGGSGATSVAVNLATTLAEAKETKVALLDLNSPVGDAASYLDLKSQFTFSDALASTSRLDPMLLESFMTVGHGVAVLPGPKQLKPNENTPLAASLAKLLRVTAQAYTHTFIDMPSSLDSDLMRVLAENSENVLLVLTPELPALWRTYRLMVHLNNLGYRERIKLILNRDNSRDEINELEIRKSLNYPIYWRLPNNYGSAISAINKGKPLAAVNHSGLSSSYRKLTQLLVGIDVAKKRRGFGKLFS